MISDILIIGAGPAGLAAALMSARDGQRVVVVERGECGGILQQCIHTGFGVEYFGQELTGPEYASKFTQKVKAYRNIKIVYGTVTHISQDKVVQIVSTNGYFEVKAKAIILATGCREKPKGALSIAGSRPSGIFSAGTAQRLINIEGKKIGDRVVIVGSGDIGLIMARRLTFEGAKVSIVIEIKPELCGLQRNIKQCLQDYNINYEVSSTVVEILGNNRVEGVVIAKVDENYKSIEGTERHIKCDTVLFAVGLIPEIDLVPYLAKDIKTRGLLIDNQCETSKAGFFACGNCVHVHDLVDNVSRQGETAGLHASAYARQKQIATQKHNVICGKNVASVVPQYIVDNGTSSNIYIRVQRKVVNAEICIMSGETLLKKESRLAVSPNETIALSLQSKGICGDVTVYIGEKQ